MVSIYWLAPKSSPLISISRVMQIPDNVFFKYLILSDVIVAMEVV
jgi:hypothetical protein